MSNDFPFKSLSEAKEQFLELSETVASLTAKAAEFETLSLANTDLTAQLSSLAIEKAAIEAKFEALNLEQVAAISAKDKEIGLLTAQVADGVSEITRLTKNQKSTKAMARELVAASAATSPASVDAGEVELEGKDLMKAMADEKDPQKLYALYEQFKRQSVTK